MLTSTSLIASAFACAAITILAMALADSYRSRIAWPSLRVRTPATWGDDTHHYDLAA